MLNQTKNSNTENKFQYMCKTNQKQLLTYFAIHRLSESTIEHARLMAQAISLDTKFDVRVSTFGTSSGILVHAEKPSTKSLSRRH